VRSRRRRRKFVATEMRASPNWKLSVVVRNSSDNRMRRFDDGLLYQSHQDHLDREIT
jgi:hypothetical protein